MVRNTAYDSYNAIKEAHPDDIVLFQVGDFFEIYGEDAKQAAELLDLNLTNKRDTRRWPCGDVRRTVAQFRDVCREIAR